MARSNIVTGGDYTIKTYQNRDAATPVDEIDASPSNQNELTLPFIFGIRSVPSLRRRVKDHET